MKAHSPLLGFNNNVRHRGRIFHIQTEDSGVKHPHVITHLFADGGRIVQSTKTSYTEFLGDDELSRKVRSLMQEQHKAMFISLRAGKFDHLLEGIPLAEPPPPPADGGSRTAAESTVAIEIGNESEEAKLVARASAIAKEPGAAAPPVPPAMPAPPGPVLAPPVPPPPPPPPPAPPRNLTPSMLPPGPPPLPPAPPPLRSVTPPMDAPIPSGSIPPPSQPGVGRERRDSVGPGGGGIRLTPPRTASIPPPPSDPGRASHPATLPPAPYARGDEPGRNDSSPPLSDPRAPALGTHPPIPRTDDEAAAGTSPPSAQDFWQLQNRGDPRTPPPMRRPERPARPDPRVDHEEGARSPSLGARSYAPPSPSSPPYRRDAPSLGAAPPASSGFDVGRGRDLPPPPAALLRGPGASNPRSLTPAHTAATGASQSPPSSPPGRYAPSRPASIFGAARPQEGTSIFGEDLISEKSLDEVILSYLAEDLEPPPKK